MTVLDKEVKVPRLAPANLTDCVACDLVAITCYCPAPLNDDSVIHAVLKYELESKVQ